MGGGLPMVLNHLVTVCIQTAPMIALGAYIFMSSASREVSLEWVGIALGLIFLEDFLLTGCWTLVPQPESWGQWNWTGKVLALAGTVLIATLARFGLARCGFTLKQADGSLVAWGVGVAMCAGMAVLAYFNGAHPANAPDTIAFHWTMPGIEEEAFYRGTLYYALDRAFLARKRVLGADLGPAFLLTALLVGGVHGLPRHHGILDFQPLVFATTAAAGLVLAWLRVRTGSLLAPVVVHNASDGVFALF